MGASPEKIGRSWASETRGGVGHCEFTPVIFVNGTRPLLTASHSTGSHPPLRKPERGVRGATESDVIPEMEMRRRERENILVALKRASGVVFGPNGAAALLGIKPATLSPRLKKQGIDPAIYSAPRSCHGSGAPRGRCPQRSWNGSKDGEASLVDIVERRTQDVHAGSD